MGVFADRANTWISQLVPYEPGRPIEEVARELGFADAGEIVKLASNENALGPSPLAVKAMRDSAAEMHRYPDGGAYYLKAALSRALGVDASCILPVNGSNEAIVLLCQAFLGPGAGIVAANPAFIVYRLVAESFRAEVLNVPTKDFRHDLNAMAAAIKPETRIVFVSNPNNPTGTMVTGAEIERFMSTVGDDVVVCFDEAYIELLTPEVQPDTLRYVREGRNVVVLRTFSKTYGLAGLRIGYAVAPPECISLLNRLRQPFNVNAMALAAAVAALEDAEHVGRTRDVVREGLEFLSGEFERLGLGYVPSVANFILVDVGEGRKVFGDLQKSGVIVRPMDVYDLPDHVRVTVGTRKENERCIKALEECLGT